MQVAKEIVHPSGKRRLRIFERSDGNFGFVEEALYTNNHDPDAPFFYWAETYRQRSGIYGSVRLAMAEIAAMPNYKDYDILK
ncbi:MAG: hypothetical protein ACLPWS_18710 [Rhodomicrobium sp.]